MTQPCALAGQLVRGPLEDVLIASYLQAWRDCGRFEPARGGALDWLLAIVRERAGPTRNPPDE